MEIQNGWLYKNKLLSSAPEGFYGFVYLITNIKEGRIYIGKKAFSYRKKSKLSKKAKKATGKRVKVQAIDSQWLKYYGSSIELKADIAALGESAFRREILHLCTSKAQMSYMEAKEQFAQEVLEKPTSYNKWIGIKAFKTRMLNGAS